MPKNLLLFFALLFTLTLHSSAQPYKNLALKGGGTRGIAYTGALQVLEEKGVTASLQKVAGTSSGAIVGALLSVGYTAAEMEQIMFRLKIQQFNDGGWWVIGGERRLKMHYGWYKGKALEKWMGKLIQQKTGNADLTFSQLHQLAQTNKKYKDLYVTATNLTSQQLQVFSWQTYPDMCIKTAVHASFAVPLYFEALLLDSTGHKPGKHTTCTSCQVYIDGGIVDNYPLNMFDTGGVANNQTLGLKLERPAQISYKQGGIAPYPITSLKSYIGAFYNITIGTLNRQNTAANEKERTIYISTGNMSPKVKKIKKAQKELLYNNGKEGALQFFETHH